MMCRLPGNPLYAEDHLSFCTEGRLIQFPAGLGIIHRVPVPLSPSQPQSVYCGQLTTAAFAGCETTPANIIESTTTIPSFDLNFILSFQLLSPLAIMDLNHIPSLHQSDALPVELMANDQVPQYTHLLGSVGYDHTSRCVRVSCIVVAWSPLLPDCLQ